MMSQILINLAVEDELSEAVLRRILVHTDRPFYVCTCYRKGGYDYLKRSISGFNKAARFIPYLVLTDLDQAQCPPVLIREWLNHPKHPNLLFRVAVREVEAWLLADGPGVARFLGIAPSLAPHSVETLPDPKQALINLARKSRRKALREAIVPPPDSTRKQGPDYNGALLPFVHQWNIAEAIRNSPSLRRTVNVTLSFQPLRHSQ